MQLSYDNLIAADKHVWKNQILPICFLVDRLEMREMIKCGFFPQVQSKYLQIKAIIVEETSGETPEEEIMKIEIPSSAWQWGQTRDG